MAITPDSTKAYVTSRNDNTVGVINLATFSVVATITVAETPDLLDTTPDGTKVYVGGDSTNKISVISTASNSVTATLTVGSGNIQGVISEFTADRVKALIEVEDNETNTGRLGHVALKVLAAVKVKGKDKPVVMYALKTLPRQEESTIEERKPEEIPLLEMKEK